MLELITREASRKGEATRKLPPEPGASSSDEPRVAEAMTRLYPIVPGHISMSAARKIAELRSSDTLIVEDKGSLIGILDRETLLTASDGRRVADCLKSIRICLTPTTTLTRARVLMIEHGVASFPVAAGPFLVGSISRSDVERSLASKNTRAVSARVAA
jgi:CBS domain-containing protein